MSPDVPESAATDRDLLLAKYRAACRERDEALERAEAAETALSAVRETLKIVLGESNG